MSMAHESHTVFQQMLEGLRPARFILRSERLGVAAIIDRSPADPHPDPERSNQVVVFPFGPYRSIINSFVVRMAMNAIADRMHQAYPGDDMVVVEHTEGRDVADHPHSVMMVTHERGESARLHDPARLDPARYLTPAQQDAFAAKLAFDPQQTAAFEQGVLDFLANPPDPRQQ